jgi:hypothetical protein
MIKDLVAGWAALEKAKPDYVKAEEFYDGTVGETFASEKVKRLIGETGEDYEFPMVGAAVDVLEGRCEVVKVSAPGKADITSWIEEVSEANRLDVYYSDLITRTFKHGDAYLMVWELWAEDETREEPAGQAETELEQVGVEFTVHDATNVRVFYDPENERRKAYAVKRWCVTLEGEQHHRWRADVWYSDHWERWITKQEAQPSNADGWEKYTFDDQEFEYDNPHGQIPFFHCRTSLLYGVPVHKRGYGSQLAMQKMAIEHITVSEAQGFPQRVGLVDLDADLDANMDGNDFPADDEALATAGDGPLSSHGGVDSNLRNGPGTTQLMQGISKLHQFDEADPEVFMGPMKQYITTMAQQTQTPLHDFQPQAQPPSGESRRVAEGPLVKRAKKMQKMLRGPIIDAWLFAMKIAGKSPTPLRISWSPPYVADGTDDWQMNELKLRCGVPQQVVLTEAGYEADTVRTWLDQEPEMSSLDTRIKRMQDISLMAQQFALAGVSASAGGPLWASLEELGRQAVTVTDRPG